MSLKNVATQFVISLVAAVIAISIYHLILTPQIKIIEAKVDTHELSMDEYVYSGNVNQNYIIEENPTFVNVAARAKEAVVYILAYEKVQDGVFNKGFKREKGSGVIVGKDGYIVTNYHVVAKASHIEITLNDKKEYLAEIVGSDQNTDLALLKIEASNLPTLTFGNSENMNVGEWVLAIGNPFGLQSTVTAGIVSAKARNIEASNVRNNIESLIQSDVVINPGSSGGALINEYGELMGINTAIISASGNYEGISFAIPANVARKIVFDLKQFGAVQRAKMGITLRDVDANLADLLEMDIVKGVFVVSSSFNGAAYDAGIKRGDVITKINNKAVNTTPEFTEKLNQFRPGDRVEIEYLRKNRHINTSIVLKNHLNTTDYVSIKNSPKLRALGIEIRNLNSIEKERLNVNGIYIVSISKGSIAQKVNMEPGFIIVKLNGKSLSSDQEFLRQLKELGKDIRVEGFYERYPGKFPYEMEIE